MVFHGLVPGSPAIFGEDEPANGAKIRHMLRLWAIRGQWELYMPNDWIIDVLADLKAFAAMNGMQATATQLEDASLVALAELSSLAAEARGGVVSVAGGHESGAGNVTYLCARRGLA
jgi:hypothetical protein